MNELKQVLHDHIIPSVALYSKVLVQRFRVEALSTQKKKLESLSKQQQRPLFNVYDTIRLFKIDLQLPRYALVTLVLGPKIPVLDKFNEKEVLNPVKLNCISNNAINDINVAT